MIGETKTTKIYMTPIGKPRMTQADRWRKRPVVLRYFDWCNEIRLKNPKLRLKDSYEVTFIIPFPKSYSKKKKASLIGQPHQQKPDLDNLLKSFNDALAKEDKYIHSIKARKLWGDRGVIILKQ